MPLITLSHASAMPEWNNAGKQDDTMTYEMTRGVSRCQRCWRSSLYERRCLLALLQCAEAALISAAQLPILIIDTTTSLSQSHLGRAHRHPSRQGMLSLTLCATSCTMATADESNHSATSMLHPHRSVTCVLYIELCCPIPPLHQKQRFAP